MTVNPDSLADEGTMIPDDVMPRAMTDLIDLFLIIAPPPISLFCLLGISAHCPRRGRGICFYLQLCPGVDCFRVDWIRAVMRRVDKDDESDGFVATDLEISQQRLACDRTGRELRFAASCLAPADTSANVGSRKFICARQER